MLCAVLLSIEFYVHFGAHRGADTNFPITAVRLNYIFCVCLPCERRFVCFKIVIMRVVIQRVTSANVSVDGSVISSIGRGLCVLVGVSRNDTAKEMEYMVRKILNLRIFDGDDGKRWMKSVVDKQYEILCVSQFTLYAVLKGNKPDFHQSMASEQSQAFYQQFLTALGSKYNPDLIKDGQFGAYMQVGIQNDGPVTITVDTASSGAEEDKVK